MPAAPWCRCQKKEGASNGGEGQGMVSCHFSYRKWVVSKPYRTRFFTPASSGQDSKRKKVGGWSKRFQTCDDGKMSAVSACRSSACPNMHETWKILQTHDHSCKSNLRHLSTNSASFCGQGTWSPAALQVPSFFLHFVRTRLGGWLQSFTVTVIFCAEKHGLLVLKSTAKDIFIQSTFFAKQLTSMTADQLQRNMSAVFLVKSWFPCHIPMCFSIPCHHWIPRKYTTVKLESYFLR